MKSSQQIVNPKIKPAACHHRVFRLSLLSLAITSTVLTSCGPSPSSAVAPSSADTASASNGSTEIRSPLPSASATAISSPTTAPSALPSAEPSAAASPMPMASGFPAPRDSSDISAVETSDKTTPSTSPTMAPTAIPSVVSPEQARAGLLTAGSWSDLDHWDFWLNLMQSPWYDEVKAWNMNPTRRIAVSLKQVQQPLADQLLSLKDVQGNLVSQSRSNMQGQSDFFINLYNQNQQGPFSLYKGDQADQLLQSGIEIPVQKDLKPLLIESTGVAPANQVDILLSVDTTGSMGDELSFLQTELQNVLKTVKANNQQLNLRASTNFYKDQGDEYLVRPFPFTTDFNLVQQQLSAQTAGGGGDYPEAVDSALADAIQEHQWQTSARARLLFLVLDAPPHQNKQVQEQLQTLNDAARQKGIRIIPVASSGVDKATEFLMRSLAISTGGEYVFLTDDSGIGGGHIEPTIGDHKVEKLNALMIRLIEKYAGVTSEQ